MLGKKSNLHSHSYFLCIFKYIVLNRMMELQSFGLATAEHVKPSYKYVKCIKNKKSSTKTQLSIKNLSSAFLLLLFGYALAIIVFVAEVFLKSNNACK
jgi:hypothetical protein